MALVLRVAKSKLSIKRELARVTVTWGRLSAFVQGKLFTPMMEDSDYMTMSRGAPSRPRQNGSTDKNFKTTYVQFIQEEAGENARY